MNGNSEQTYPEAGPTGAYTGAPTPGSAESYGSTAGAYGAGAGSPNYGQGANYTAGSAGDPYAPGYVPPAGGGIPPYGYPPTPPPPPPPVPGSPNPGLAALLGFIPGVGAMYNGQFPKGIAHIVIFAILTSLTNHVNDIFGLFVAGWVFYMVFDAYQTARARRDGMVAPDPFGLNNIGERFGMPGSPNWGDFVARPAPTAGTPPADPTRPADVYSNPAVPPVAGAAVPPPPYTAYSATTSNPYAGPGMGYGYPEPPFAAAPGAPYGSTPPYGSAPGYGNTYAPPIPPIPPVPPMPINPGDATRSGLPVGAFWLIGLGLLALIGTLGHNYYFVPRYFGGVIPIALGIGIIIQRALAAKRFYPEGSAAHTWYILHQSRVGVVLIAVGGLTLLSSMSLLTWHHSWPYLLILFGLMQVADRAAYNRMLAETPIPVPPYAAAPAVSPVAEPVTGSNGQEAR